jgi:putative transposase
MEIEKRLAWVKQGQSELSISRQCQLLKVNRSRVYYQPQSKQAERDKPLLDAIDQIMTETPFLGSRKVTYLLQGEGHSACRQRVQGLLRQLGLRAVQPKKRWKGKAAEKPSYPYLLENLVVTAPNQVWCTDITYIPTRFGWGYLAAILDRFSRKILGWRLSNTLEAAPCVALLKETIARYGPPGILNSDKGSQYTSQAWIDLAQANQIQISMAGKGRCYDNIHMERFWRSLKQEEVYLKDYQSLVEARNGIAQYVQQYNHKRPHQSLLGRTPANVYHAQSTWTSQEEGQEVRMEKSLRSAP